MATKLSKNTDYMSGVKVTNKWFGAHRQASSTWLGVENVCCIRFCIRLSVPASEQCKGSLLQREAYGETGML